MKIVTATEMKQIDRRTIDEIGIPGERLMERAGEGIFRVVVRMLSGLEEHPLASVPSSTSPLGEVLSQRRESSGTPEQVGKRVVGHGGVMGPATVLLFAGRGNNGGDAFVVARLLQEFGIPNLTALLAEVSELRGDAATNFARLKQTGAEIVVVREGKELERISEREYSFVLDGILGTGINSAVKGLYAEVIEFINRLGKKVIAIDIPSGINGDTGVHEGACVRADVTVTMGLPKEGLLRRDALNFVGKLQIVDIGIPPQVIEDAESAAELLTEKEMSTLLPRRKRITHKGDYGRVFVLAGSRGLTGAAAMVSSAAMRTGSGLVFLGIPGSLNAILEAKLTEPMTIPLDETPEGTIAYSALSKILEHLSACTTAVIGPGISTHPETARLVQEILKKAKVPLLVDADGLNCLQGSAELLHRYAGPLIVTPHPGEMSRLSAFETGHILEHPWEIAADFAERNGVIVILKSAETVIADTNGSLYINIAGDAGMASGGMGDVLSGVVGSLMGQGLTPIDAAQLGTFVHGTTGEMVAKQKGQLGLIASDVIELLPTAFESIRKCRQA